MRNITISYISRQWSYSHEGYLSSHQFWLPDTSLGIWIPAFKEWPQATQAGTSGIYVSPPVRFLSAKPWITFFVSVCLLKQYLTAPRLLWNSPCWQAWSWISFCCRPSLYPLSARILQVCANHTHCSGNCCHQGSPRRFTSFCKGANSNYILGTSRWSLSCTHGILPAWVPACCLFRLAQMSQAQRNSWWLLSLTKHHKRHLLYLRWKKK